MKTILVEGETTFRIKVEDGDLLTFGPWSPPGNKPKGQWTDPDKRGTLRVYRGSKDNIIAVFSNVTSFRDTSLDYSEKIAIEEVSTVWKSDEKGYEREVKENKKARWVTPDIGAKALPAPKKIGRPRKKRGPGRPRKVEVVGS